MKLLKVYNSLKLELIKFQYPKINTGEGFSQYHISSEDSNKFWIFSIKDDENGRAGLSLPVYPWPLYSQKEKFPVN